MGLGKRRTVSSLHVSGGTFLPAAADRRQTLRQCQPTRRSATGIESALCRWSTRRMSNPARKFTVPQRGIRKGRSDQQTT